MSELLENAFRALGPGPTPREVEAVGSALRGSRNAEVLALFAAAADDLEGSFGALVELASEAGAHAFVALDLLAEVVNPGCL